MGMGAVTPAVSAYNNVQIQSILDIKTKSCFLGWQAALQVS